MNEMLNGTHTSADLSAAFRIILDGIPDSIALISSEGRILWANRGTSTLLGLPSDPTHMSCREAFCSAEAVCESCPVHRTFSSGKVDSSRSTGRDGRIWGIKTFPIQDAQTNTRQVVRWGSDITEKIRVEEDAMRNARLASLGELAAGVAHEINNPNALILLNSSLLRDIFSDLEPLLENRSAIDPNMVLGGLSYRRLRDELPHVLEETVDAAQRIRRIVEDLKNFARQEIADHGWDVDLNRTVRTAIRLASPTLRNSTDSFRATLSDNLPPLRGNAQRLEQVVLNLLINAAQALPDRSRRIDLSTEYDSERGHVVLRLADEGVGIAPEHLPHIFDPFFTTRREKGGTGLGLPVSSRIVKEHGGHLYFSSRPGEGTTVVLTLPALPSHG